MKACNKMGDVIQGKQGDGADEVNIDTPKMKMKLAKLDPSKSMHVSFMMFFTH